MVNRTVPFLAVVLMGIALIPAGAHLFALPNKIDATQDAYFTMQQIYAGWWFLGLGWIAALVVNLVMAIRLRGHGTAFLAAGVGFLAIAAALAVFFTWTFPANQATSNWTVVPENWQALRMQWEYSHAVNAAIVFIGFCAVVLAAITSRR